MCVFVVVGGHAPPVLEPAEAPFHSVARLVSFRGVGLGVQTPVPGRKDGLDALLFQPSAESVAVVGPVGDQGQGRAGSGLDPGPGWVRSWRWPQTQGVSPLIRQDVDLGAEAAPATPEGGIPPLFGGVPVARACAHNRAVPQPRGQLRRGQTP